MVCGGNGTGDGGLLLVIGKTLASEVGRTALGDLEDDGSLDIPGETVSSGVNAKKKFGRTERPREQRWRSRRKLRSGWMCINKSSDNGDIMSQTHDGLFEYTISTDRGTKMWERYARESQTVKMYRIPLQTNSTNQLPRTTNEEERMKRTLCSLA